MESSVQSEEDSNNDSKDNSRARLGGKTETSVGEVIAMCKAKQADGDKENKVRERIKTG